MGNGKLSPAVVDAGPIIHLKEIGCLPYLQLFPTLYIPDAVWSETVGHGHVSAEDLSPIVNLQRHTVSDAEVEKFIKDNDFEDLDLGERECLYLCREIRVSLILTDDLAVRDAAKRLNLSPIGSLGVVVKAYHTGKISLMEAETRLNDLYETSSLFVTKAIVDIATNQLHKLGRSG